MIIVIQGNPTNGQITLAHEGAPLEVVKQVLEGMTKAVEDQLKPQSRLVVPAPHVPPDLLKNLSQNNGNPG